MTTTSFIYAILAPACTILAYKRIPFDNLLINGTLWAIPFGIGMHVLLSDSASGSKLWSGIASLMVIYGVLVYVGDRGEAWLARRKRG